MRLRTWHLAAAATLALGAGCAVVPSGPGIETAPVAVGGTSQLATLFVQVSAETGVPAEFLAAESYIRTRFAMVDVVDAEHAGTARGIFGLPARELSRGAALAGVTDLAATHDPLASIRAGAALWRDATGGATTLDAYLDILDRASAAEISAAIHRGIDGHAFDGGRVVVGAQLFVNVRGAAGGDRAATADYDGADWDAASGSNFDVGARGVGDIDHIVIHDTEGNFDGTVSWFQDPAAQVSAHYVTRSSDGHIVQMVHEKDVAWHDKCFNAHTVGIEHEGFQAHPEQWYTEPMYVESAKLAAYLADKYGIAKEEGPIVGHGDAPDCSDHTDPGPGWDWAHYIDLVKTGGAPTFAAGDVTVDAPAQLASGDTATVTITIANTGNTTWDLDATRLGTAEPQDRDSALFVDGNWIAPNRATGVATTTGPGQTGTFTFQIVAPQVDRETQFDEAFQMVEEGITWFGPEVHVALDVVPAADQPQNPGDGGCAVGGGSTSGSLVLVFGVVAPLVVRRRRRR